MANDKWLAWPPVSGMVVGFDTYSRTTRRFLNPVEVSVPERASLPAASPTYRYPPISGGRMLHLSAGEASPLVHVAGVGGPADIRVRVGMADFFHTPVGACRDDAHAPCHQQAEEPEDGDDDDYAQSCSLLASGILVPCAVLSTCTTSDTVTGVIVRACGVWSRFSFFVSERRWTGGMRAAGI